MRKSSRFRMHMARNGITDFDGYVQKYSPLLRNMKTARVENLLEEELYNIGDEDTARHWLTPLTGISFESNDLAKNVSRKTFSFSWLLFILSESIFGEVFSQTISCTERR